MSKESREGVCVRGVSVPEFMFVCQSVCLSVPAVARTSLSYVNTFQCKNCTDTGLIHQWQLE